MIKLKVFDVTRFIFAFNNVKSLTKSIYFQDEVINVSCSLNYIAKRKENSSFKKREFFNFLLKFCRIEEIIKLPFLFVQ